MPYMMPLCMFLYFSLAKTVQIVFFCFLQKKKGIIYSMFLYARKAYQKNKVKRTVFLYFKHYPFYICSLHHHYSFTYRPTVF